MFHEWNKKNLVIFCYFKRFLFKDNWVKTLKLCPKVRPKSLERSAQSSRNAEPDGNWEIRSSKRIKLGLQNPDESIPLFLYGVIRLFEFNYKDFFLEVLDVYTKPKKIVSRKKSTILQNFAPAYWAKPMTCVKWWIFVLQAPLGKLKMFKY